MFAISGVISGGNGQHSARMAAIPAIFRFGRGGSAKAQPKAVGAAADDAFAAAMRHSGRVRMYRRVIPLICIGLVVGPVLWSVVAPLARTASNVTVGAVSISGTRIRMDAPKLSGFNKDPKASEVTARDAVQDIKTPSVVELNKLAGRMEQETNSFMRVTAEWGRFDQTADKLDLKGDVKVRTDKGHEADLKSARVDTKSGDIVSQEAVEVRSKSGIINADSMVLKDNGKYVMFQGRVRSVFTPEEAEAEAQPQQTEKTQP
jgi:lipopolysaccharide export system protein LptC